MDNNRSNKEYSETKPQNPMGSVNTPPVPTINQRSGDKSVNNHGRENVRQE